MQSWERYDSCHLLGDIHTEYFIKVWQLSDYRKVGSLDKDGFFVALCLISLAQQGKRLGLDAVRENGITLHSFNSNDIFPNCTTVHPPKLMDVPPMKQDAPPMKQEDWAVSPQERKLYLDIFRQNDDDGDGFITGAQARNLFSSSGLPLQLLGQIWYGNNALSPQNHTVFIIHVQRFIDTITAYAQSN